MNPIEIPALTAEQVDAVATLYRTTHNVRLRTRAQMVLLAVEQHLRVREIAVIVRECEGTVRCWLKRYAAHGSDGLQDAWAGGAPAKVTQAYQDQLLQLVWRRPRTLDLPLLKSTPLLTSPKARGKTALPSCTTCRYPRRVHAGNRSGVTPPRYDGALIPDRAGTRWA